MKLRNKIIGGLVGIILATDGAFTINKGFEYDRLANKHESNHQIHMKYHNMAAVCGAVGALLLAAGIGGTYLIISSKEDKIRENKERN